MIECLTRYGPDVDRPFVWQPDGWYWDGNYAGCDDCGAKLLLGPEGVPAHAAGLAALLFTLYGTGATYDGAAAAEVWVEIDGPGGPRTAYIYYQADGTWGPEHQAYDPETPVVPAPAGPHQLSVTVAADESITSILYRTLICAAGCALRDRPVLATAIQYPGEVAIAPPSGACPGTLLPPNASPLEHALECVVGIRIDGLPVAIRDLWHTANTPVDWLPAQAWGLSIDEWDPLWSEGRQREVIAAAIGVHRRKGTIGSIRAALEAAGYHDAVITEGVYPWRYGDGSLYGAPGLTYGDANSWAQYTVDLPQPLTPAQGNSVRRLLAKVAPARCHLYAITYAYAPWVYGDGTLYGAAKSYYASGGVA